MENLDSRSGTAEHLDIKNGYISTAPDNFINGTQTHSSSSPERDWRIPPLNLVNGDPAQYESPRYRPRKFPYAALLPYPVESDDLRLRNLGDIIRNLYIAIEAGDFTPDAVHWTKELKSWLSLKFDPPRQVRARLTWVYYELSLAPGIDNTAADRFASMFMTLIKKKSYLKPGKDLELDWKPLASALKAYCLPKEAGLVHSTIVRRNVRTLMKMCAFAQTYFKPSAIPEILEKYLPHYSGSVTEGAFVVLGLFNLLLPSAPPPEGETHLYPQHYLPTLFHLSSLISRSRLFDINFIDIYSRLARDCLPAGHVPFTEYGVFTKEQSSLIFSTILRLLDIPVGQSTSPYSSNVDVGAGLAVVLDKDHKKHPVTHHIARWIVMSLSPACVEKPESILSNLEGLIQAIETFFHPSNTGQWTKNLSQLVYYLADFFVMRWNREKNGESELPDERRLNDQLKRRFVLCLREVIFMGIYAKSGTAMSFSLSTLQNLAYLEPSLILPGALQRIYPSMQGLVEVHRTTSSLRSLQILSRTLVLQKGFRCHVTTLLGLALPGIDANDLDKTLHTLSYIQATCYNIPFHDLTQGHEEVQGSALAIQWVTSEVERMERDGAGVEMDYENELSDEDEAMILRSSTTGFAEFLSSFLERIFTLLENLPDASRVRTGSPEEMVQNTLPATFTPLLASLSEELYDNALNKIADFISSHVIYQARDAAAFICNSLCKVNPKKALNRLVPLFIRAIRVEIDENGAASTRNTGSDVLPRDRALVWNVSMLSMCIVHVGDAVLDHKDALYEVAIYMQSNCKGIPTVHISNFVHHLLLNLTAIYPVDYKLYEADIYERGLNTTDWGRISQPEDVKINWHYPSPAEIDFALSLFEDLSKMSLENLTSLIGENSHIKAESASKEWSDELSRNIVLLRLIVSGMSYLFDWSQVANILDDTGDSDQESFSHDNHRRKLDGMEVDDVSPTPSAASISASKDSHGILTPSELEAILGGDEESEPKPVYEYPAGSDVLKDGSDEYIRLHHLREKIGWCFHAIHLHLTERHEDDVSCFTALYSAYRSWFIDVGIERSAHTLDRVTRLLSADIHPYKVSGLRKEYPRPLLLRRAHVYHLQRLRHNAAPRILTSLDKRLLRDLAESSLSSYTDIRTNAQYAGESAMKVLVGARPYVLPFFLEDLEQSIKANDEARIKGAVYSLLLGSLGKTIERDWRYAPRAILAYLALTTSEIPAIQKAVNSATYVVMDYGRPSERQVFVNEKTIDLIKCTDEGAEATVAHDIEHRKQLIKMKRSAIEEKKADLALELIRIVKNSHWRKASRAATMVVSLGLRFEHIGSSDMIELITTGANNTHPGLRGLFSGALVALFSLIEMRASCQHSYENYMRNKQKNIQKIKIKYDSEDPEWTSNFLKGFSDPKTKIFVDHDHPGWLVWGDRFAAFDAFPKSAHAWDEVEINVRKQLGQLMSREWFATFFDYLKQEPRDPSSDRFRMASAMLLLYAFELVIDGLSSTSFDDIKEEVGRIFEDGSDKHQHRATAEILGALITSVTDRTVETREKIWDFAFPIVNKVFDDGLTPENSGYWTTFLHLVLQGKDPRRAWPFITYLSGFRLDMNSNAAFKESSKIQLLQQCIVDNGWHFQLDGPVLENFLAHIDHPYKQVREAMGQVISAIFRYRYHESYTSVKLLMEAQSNASSVGIQPYKPSTTLRETITDVFSRLEKWRQERVPGQQAPSQYTMGCKTVLLWLESTLTSHECASLVDFFPDLFLQQILHMMDVKEDPELMSLAYHVYRHLPNIPHTVDQAERFIAALIKVGSTSPSWHQRLRILINVQTLYFRRLFLTTEAQKRALFDCVANTLHDTQVEVRMGAASTLSGMIRCSPVALRESVVQNLKKKFTKILVEKKLPPRAVGTNSPAPEHSKIVIERHSAVLGLGALVSAFPYMSPPPLWLPDILATLAVRASGSPGIVGKGAKSILSEFRKTRQDTWHVDKKVFLPEQLEDLDGVLWKPYFA